MNRYYAFWGVLALLLAAGAAAGLRADAQPANVAGTWQMTVEGSQGSFTAVLSIQQDGEKIKGTSKSDFGDASLDGTVKGNAIDFVVHVHGDNGDFDVEHTGTVDGDTMKGTTKMQGGSGDSFQWSATRQK
ncbi:MAG: hypothetical protein ACLP1Y_05805 [Candidatus Acidiferrales bacterium]